MMRVKENGDGTTMLTDIISDFITPEVLNDDIIKRALEEVEGVYKIEGMTLYTKEHGILSPVTCSNGMKALMSFILFNEHKELVSSACMGANCGPFLRELSFKYDFEIAWDYFVNMGWEEEVCAQDIDTGTVFTTVKDLLMFY